MVKGGEREIPEVMMAMVPEAWQDNQFLSPTKAAFYEYNSCIMEPWDGPAMMAFTDGRFIGATLDRNGLRPSRYYVTEDDRSVLCNKIELACMCSSVSVCSVSYIDACVQCSSTADL